MAPTAKLDLLIYLHQEQSNQLSYRRRRELQIFSWSNAILLAIAGASLTGVPKSFGYMSSQNVWSNIVILVAVLCLSIFSISWQLYQRQRAASHQKILANLAQLLGCFDGADSIFPQNWKNWGNRYTTFKEQISYPSKISATMLSGIIALTSLLIKNS